VWEESAGPREFGYIERQIGIFYMYFGGIFILIFLFESSLGLHNCMEGALGSFIAAA
jgi:hypothetical protein